MKKVLALLAYAILCNTYFVFAGKAKMPVAPNEKKLLTITKSNQQRVLTGTIYDETGVSLPGATIKVEGKERGAVTNGEGKYTIQINTNAEVLIVSYIGYINQRITVGERKVLDVKLLPNPKNALDEVAVVAFGTQKKESVIGSITTVRPGDLRVPSSNLTTALAGRVAGIISYQRSGEPGADNADFFVRGVTTFGTNNKPLILIDGIELTSTDLARLQTDDIATFSIMKDATATALYGARGANGVILVTTKQGVAGQAKISIRAENSASMATQNVELADPVTYMKLANEAVLTRNPGAAALYLPDQIENTEKGTNPLVYPANDWRKMLFKDYAMNQRYYLNVNGGGTVARYYVSGGFNKDNGVLKVDGKNNFNNNINLKSYTLRTNVNVDLTKSTELIVRLSGNFDDYNGPLDSGTDMYRKVMRSNPVRFPAFYPVDEAHKFVKHIMFGNYGNNTFLNPYADMVKGYRDESRSQMMAQFEIKQGLNGITQGLSARAMLNLGRTSLFNYKRAYAPFWYQLAGYDPLTNQYVVSKTNDNGREYLDFLPGDKKLYSTFYLESAINYNRTFASKHDVGGVLVMINREALNSESSNDIMLSLPFRNIGVSGRATYAYDKRYFAEFNFGYNGTEKFAENNRFGFFPSAGLAWSVSNEKFFEPLKSVISNLRFRYTYGLVGNDQIGDANDRFFYLSRVTLSDPSRAAVFGRDLNEIKNGVSIQRYENSLITWERAAKQNVAMELSLYGKANLVAEYYTEKRDNILMARTDIPNTVGFASIQRSNVGKASGKGIDLSLDFQHAWSKNLWFSVRGNLTYAKSRYSVFEEPNYSEPGRYRVGSSINQYYGYIAERLFVDDQEAANSPKQDFGSAVLGGDIKYTDVNGDGIINQADIVPIGNPTLPEVIYGFGFSLSYKKFDISAFAQGSANQSFWINPAATSPFVPYVYPNTTESTATTQYTNQLLQAYADSYWSEENRNLYATLPRLSTSVNANNIQPSTWFMRNAAFLRLKQVEFGYTFSKSLLDRIKASNLRLYMSGTNLLMLSKFKIWDSEMAGNGLGYPLQKVFNFGLNLTF